MCLSVNVIVRADVDEENAHSVEDKDDAVLARETRCEALRERALETMRAQRGSVRVFGDELHHGQRFGFEFGMAVDEGGQSLVKSAGRENLPHANLSLRKRSRTDLWRRVLPARYSMTLR